MTMTAPAAMAREGAHEAVANILRDVPRGRLLDVPAGHGALAVQLKELGFEVAACDLYPQIFEVDGIEIKAGNLDDTLPYDEEAFAYVVCIEGLEHIENPANAIREFSRLLKPGGTLVVSVPNIMNIEERLKWLFAGYTSHFKPLSSEVRTAIAKEYGGIEEVALHVNPIAYSEVRFLLERNGFELKSVHADQKKEKSWLFFPIVGLIRLASRFSPASKRRKRWTNELNADEVLLGGNTLIFKATKL
ncbi:MAG: class I SAM-dependent methyltransferase [Pyrinomonadaceae bacterium]